MSAFEYLTVNSLTSYPFKDGRAVFDPLPLNADVFLDILFVAIDRTILRPYISRLQATDEQLNIFFKDAANGADLFTVAIPSGEVVNHFDNLTHSFYGFSHSKAYVKFIFGPGMPVFFALKQDAPYDPEHTELSPGAVIYSVPKVISLDYESYINVYNNTQDVVSVKTYYSGETAEIEAGTNTEFYHEAPNVKYIDVGRGLGKGLHNPCNSGDIEDVLTINKIGPDANGNVFLKATECYATKLLTENDRVFLRAVLPSYTAFSIPHQNPNVFDVLNSGNAHHGLVLENFCSPKCPPENLNSFAEYLNRVTDGAADVFKFVHLDKETRGTCTLAGSELTALDFCITSSVFDSSITCSSGFVKYFHEGRKIRLYYGQGVYHTYSIKEVLSSSKVSLFEEPYPLVGSELSVLEFKVIDLGFIDSLNYSIAAHNLKTSKYDEPYIESNYTTVDAYYINKRYGTFITSTTVIYNPGKASLDFLAIFEVAQANLAEIIPGSIKVKKSNGDIFYGTSTGSIECKDYAIVEAIFFIPCGGHRGEINVSIRHTSEPATDFLNSPFNLVAVSAACVQTALAAKVITALESTSFTYNFNIPGATNYTLSGDKPSWLSEDLNPSAAANLFGTPTGTDSAIYPFTLQATTDEGTFSQRITLKYVAKPVMQAELTDKNIDVYLPDITSRTYVTSAPLWTLGASNSPTSYNSSGLPAGLSLNKNKIVGKFNVGSTVTYPSVFNVSFWASNAAGSGTPVDMTITLNAGLTLPTAVSGQNYCYDFVSDPDRLGEVVVSGAPSWLTFKSSDTLNTGECGFSGVPSGNTTKEESLLVRFLYEGTYKAIYLTLPFSAKASIVYPPAGTVIDIYPPDYSSSGEGREWSEASPLLTVEGSNNPTSYTCTGLPEGLTLENSKIVGKITAPAESYTVTLSAENFAGSGVTSVFYIRLNSAEITVPSVAESAPFCYKLLNIGGVQTLQLFQSQNLPSWLTFSTSTSSTCNLSGTAAGAVSQAIEVLLQLNLKGGNTVRKIVIPYTAKPRILSPTSAQRVETVDPAYDALVFDESLPFLTIQATNNPSIYTGLGLPPGLTVGASSGKIVGTLASGEWNCSVTAANSAGTASVNFIIFVTATPDIFYIYENQDYCFRADPDSEGTLYYSLTGTLPSWLSFDPSITAACNLQALAPTQATNQTISDLVLRRHRPGTTNTVNQQLTFSYIAKPRINYPAHGTIFEISPPDYKDTVFTSSNPLFTVSATNNPTSFTATGFNANTLRIDSSGKIIGTSGTGITATPLKITLTASNAAGVSAPIEVYLKVRSTANQITVTKAVPLCYQLVKTDEPTSVSLITPADISWISLDSSSSTDCELSGVIPSGFLDSRLFEITVVRNYSGGSTRENIKINAVLAPRITSITSGSDETTRNEYTIAPPDYQSRTYTAAAPLMTIQASNNPTNFIASGLPAGLSMDSSGRVIGGPVTVSPGVYQVSVKGVNAGGEGVPAIFNIRVSLDPLNIETFTGVDGCFKITTKDGATKYTLNGTLPNNLIFEGVPGIDCNVRGSISPGTSDLFKVYQLSSVYSGGSSRIYLNLTNRSVPVIVYPAQGQTLKIIPSDYFDVTFSADSPLFAVQATNNATAFTATGLPSGLQINEAGKIVGKTSASAQSYSVSLKASNPAGDSSIVTFILDLSRIIPSVVWASPGSIPYYQPLGTSQLNASVVPAVSGSFIYTPGLGATLGSTGTKTLRVTFNPTDTLNYAAVSGETTIVSNAGAPVINSIYMGTENTLKTVYTIAPPDYQSRTYTAAAPLMTIQASNNPTNFIASGLPAGLSMDSSGRVIGGPVTVSPGVYQVSVKGVNSIGEGAPGNFNIEVFSEIPTLNTYTDENLCLELNTMDGASRYELQQGSALFTGLVFNSSVSAACNISGAPVASVATQEATLNIRSIYPGGHSSRFFKLNHLALPSLVFPLSGYTFKKSPGDFLGVVYTEENPLFTLVASNTPEGYIFYNFPEGLYVDEQGRVLGELTATDNQLFNVSVAPLNASGEGATVNFILDFTPMPVAISWDNPTSIVYGTSLSSQQLNAAAGGIPGIMSYFLGGVAISPGTVLSAGTKTLTATFVPTDTARYTTASKQVTLIVNKQTPVLTWATPATITYGTRLSSTQLNASCNVQGTIIYSSIAGTLLNAGDNVVTTTFTPSNADNYSTATKTVIITVTKATAVLVWSNPADIPYLTPLTSIQLNAIAKSDSSAQARIVAGTATYTYQTSSANNAVLPAGTHTLNVSFVVSASESSNFITTPLTASVTINVTPVAIPVSWAPKGSMVYGTPLNSDYLNAQIGLTGATVVYSPNSGAVLTAGNETLTATVSSTNPNYSSVILTRVVTVTKAPRTGSITSQNSGKVQLTYTLAAAYTGELSTVAYTSSNSTILSITGTTAAILKAQTAVITAVIAETVNYQSLTITQTFTGTAGDSTVTITSAGNTTLGTNLTLVASTSGSLGGVTFTSLDTTKGVITNSNVYVPIAAGTGSVQAALKADSNYAAASTTKSITIAKGASSIVSNIASSVAINTSTPLAVSTSGSNAVWSVSSTPSTNVTFNASTQTVTFSTTGSKTLTFYLAEDSNYTAATFQKTISVF
jgi:hypothetical protein